MSSSHTLSEQGGATEAPPPLFRAARAGSAIGASTIAALVAGFLLQLTIAYRFGASGETDAFFMAQGVSELLGKILLGGSLTSVFLPVFVEYLTQGSPARAWTLANRLLHLFGGAAAIAISIMAVFTDQIVSFIAPGFSPDIHAQTVHLLRFMLPGFFFLLLSDLLIAMLHSLRVFGIPALARVITPLVTLTMILALGNAYGITTLALGTLAGATVNIVLLMTVLLRAGYIYRPQLSMRDPDVRRVLKLVAPFILSVLAAQAAGIVYRILVSHLPEGSLSALKFGEKIFQMTNTLFLSTITTVAFPAFSRAVAGRAWDEIRGTMRQAIRLMFFLSIPLTAGIALLRLPLVRLLYERGSFTPEDTAATAGVLALFLIGLVANGISSLLGHLALALKVARTSVLVTIVAQLCSIGLFALLTPTMGIRGLALASALGPYILALLYLVFLRRHVGRLVQTFFESDLPIFAACGIMLVLGILAGQRLEAFFPLTRLGDVARIGIPALVGILAYGMTAWIFRVQEVRTVREIVYYAIRGRRS